MLMLLPLKKKIFILENSYAMSWCEQTVHVMI